jgi:hypothetical protein
MRIAHTDESAQTSLYKIKGWLSTQSGWFAGKMQLRVRS